MSSCSYCQKLISLYAEKRDLMNLKSVVHGRFSAGVNSKVNSNTDSVLRAVCKDIY